MDGNQPTPAPEQQLATPEVSAEQSLSDKLEANVAPAAAEASVNGPKADDGAAVAQAQVAALTTDVQTADDATTAAPSNPAQATPQLAADVDVIEPEWVKKAEEVVAKHRDDPRAEEAAVEALQIDYLKKRYNLDVKSGDDKP